MKHSRLLELDALRGIAAFAVVLYHYFFRYDQIYGHETLPVEWSYYGRYGVQLFFVISGFVIFWTLNRTKKPADFIVSRFSRLYPAFFCAAIITFSLIAWFGLPGREIPAHAAAANLLMFHEYLGIPHIDGVYWTLTVELTFYFWIFTFFLFGLLQRVDYILLGATLSTVLVAASGIELNPMLATFFLLGFAPYFLSGICFYRLAHDQHKIRSYLMLPLCLLAIYLTSGTGVFLIFLMVFIGFLLIIHQRLKILAAPPLVFLGAISYSLYLVHQNIGYIIINEFYAANYSPLLAIACSTVASLALASALYVFVEKPALKKLRSAYADNERIQRFVKSMPLLGARWARQ